MLVVEFSYNAILVHALAALLRWALRGTLKGNYGHLIGF